MINMIIFFYGQDTFRSHQKLQELKDKFRRDVDSGGHGLVTISGESADAKKINESIGSSSLFTKKMMVVIENIFSNKQQSIFSWLVEYLENLEKNSGNDNIIVFCDEEDGTDKSFPKYKKVLWDFLIKQKFVQEFSSLPAQKLSTWVREEVEKRNGKMSMSAASAMVGLTNGDLWQIDNEINKLIGYKAGQMIEAHDVEAMVKGKYDENIFALTDAIGNRNKALATKLLNDELSAGAAEQYVFSMVVRQFRIMLQIREALDAGLTSRKISSTLKLHPFVVQKGMTQVRNFSAIYLRRVYEHLAEIDYFSKTGQRDLRTMLDLMIVKM